MPPFARRYARSTTDDSERAPPINIRFFYASPLPIDDPLSPVPPPSTSTSAPTNLSPRPFSTYDNTLLDRAWNNLRREILKCREAKESEKASYHKERRASEASLKSIQSSRGLPAEDSAGSSSRSRRGSLSKTSQGISRVQELSQWGYWDQADASVQNSRLRSGTLRASMGVLELAEGSPEGLTGLPFARAPARVKNTVITSQGTTRTKEKTQRLKNRDDSPAKAHYDLSQEPKMGTSQEEPSTNIPVGVSRLHQVLMPGLSMEPIYWSPVHDIAIVARATWFYKDSMLPVEIDVANMLEAGYTTLRPWTNTWEDELKSAVEVGAIGEEKILHSLWPPVAAVKGESRPGSSMGLYSTAVEFDPEKQRDETVKAACDLLDVSTSIDGIDTKAAGTVLFGRDGQKRLYLTSSVIYANDREAYILRPNLQPSAYYGRRPLAHYIRKGRNIGIAVVRGFDQAVWDKQNPPKTGKTVAAAKEGVSTSQAGRPANARMRSDPGLSKANRPQVTDLILVIHGIGQKLSERVESFHFTHAMNGFRREVGVELGTPSVKGLLREEMGGIMVLPVNWRSTLTFEEGGYRDGSEDLSANSYGLKDITVETLPSMREVIADVMLDIPYYLSHHQQSMIKAVTAEANRIHRLWCKNNPGFEHHGRVHLLAHSLGSVMAVDILSKQPTNMRPQTEADPDPDHFRFDTKNLYLCGSPVGFFLLLKKAGLLPRRDRSKPHSDGDDYTAGVAGEDEGTYGCIAVDNIYNIINPYDPVAYRINATVDATYAASLRSTFIPSAAESWFAFGNPFKGSANVAASMVHVKKPSLVQRLPSNVELETHNFTREEIAERRFYMLNDNGQIDFFLKYGGGALEIQYLTMLGAHSSYWLSKDFVRFITVETGRKLGRAGTLDAMKVVKKKAFVV